MVKFYQSSGSIREHFYAVPFFFIFEMLVSCWDTRKLNKVVNLKLLFLLCANAYLDNTTDYFYKFQNMQQS